MPSYGPKGHLRAIWLAMDDGGNPVEVHARTGTRYTFLQNLDSGGPLTLGYLVERYRVKAIADKAGPDKWVFARTDGSGLPLWDSGVRQALKRAAVAEGCDFPGLGPHSFRRANITWRQEVGGSSIEASKIAGHSTVRMTEEYTKIQLTGQDELTRLIQDRLASAGETQQPTVVQ